MPVKKDNFSPAIRILVDMLDHAFERKAWHGTNLRGALRGVTVKQALWRPNADRHCIWELTLHAAYWKYAVWRRLSGGKRGRFPRKGSNWLSISGAGDESAWSEDVGLLIDQHKRLRDCVIAFPEDQLFAISPGSRWTNHALIEGATAHDLYHTGQIQLLKRLQE